MKKILFSAAMIAATSFSAHALIETNDLQGKWEFVSVDGVDGNRDIWFEIDDKKINGFDGCNDFRGRINVKAGNVKAVLMGTSKSCGDNDDRTAYALQEMLKDSSVMNGVGKRIRFKNDSTEWVFKED